MIGGLILVALGLVMPQAALASGDSADLAAIPPQVETAKPEMGQVDVGQAEPAQDQTEQVETRYPSGQIQERYRTMRLAGEVVRDGLAEEFYPDGKLKGTVFWKNGKQEGDAVFYHPDGRKSYATHYRQGKKWGFATVWYANGQKQWEAMYQDGLTHGVWREWYRDGKRKFMGMYSKGRLDGRATWWYPNGRLQQERDYSQGQSLPGSVKAYDSTGRQTFPAPQSKSKQDRPESAMAESLAH
jgi:antitoxin component YwqK of YwqJK toxin-antitoxin module